MIEPGQRTVVVTLALSLLGFGVWSVGAFTGADTGPMLQLIGWLSAAFGVRGVGEHIGKGLKRGTDD